MCGDLQVRAVGSQWQGNHLQAVQQAAQQVVPPLFMTLCKALS